MASFYIDAYGGSDFGINHSTFTDGEFLATTGGSGNNQLTKTGAFSGLNAGDLIRLQDNGSGDVVTGTYEIASPISADVILLTEDITGGGTESVTDVKAEAHDASISKPYGGVQTFLADPFTVERNDIIYIGNDKEVKNRAGTTWSWSNVTTSSLDEAISFRAYAPGNAGGAAFVKTRGDGTTIPIAKIDGNGNATITGTTTSSKYCGFVGIEFRNTTSWLVYYQNGWTFHDCKFSDGNAVYFLNGGGNGQKYFNCEFAGDDTDTNTDGVLIKAGSTVEGCYFHDFGRDGVLLGNSYASISFCLFENCKQSGINTSDKDWINISNNTFVAETGSADAIGVWCRNSHSTQNSIRNNLFAGFNGTGTNPAGTSGGCGIYIEPGSSASTLGPNAFYDCTNDVDNDADWNPMTDFTNVSLASDPFVDASAGDYSLDSDSDAFNAVTNMTLANTEANLSYGAVQQVDAGGGGGGGGTTDTNGPLAWNDGVSA